MIESLALPALKTLGLTGGAGGPAYATGGTAYAPAPWTEGDMTVNFAPSIGIGSGRLPSWLLIAAAGVAAVVVLRKLS